jgi:hypothetical protein
MKCSSGQLLLEWQYLKRKLKLRDLRKRAEIKQSTPKAHPLFVIVDGEVESWERGV